MLEGTLVGGALLGFSLSPCYWLFVVMTLFHLWNLPGDVLAAPESASGLDRCNLSLSLRHPQCISLSARIGCIDALGPQLHQTGDHDCAANDHSAASSNTLEKILRK